ncbi:MAG: glycosyltransferase [Thermoplasmatales archaeon]|nr:glycosyltransferase [Thermoplasmatales archaeon]
MEMEDCTVILPTYNEADNIGKMVSSLRALYPRCGILVMDDRSEDGTDEIVRGMMADDPLLGLVVRDPSDKGLSASVMDGISKVETKYFINMDSDFQHPPEALAGIHSELGKGADLCVGVRKDRTSLSSFGRWVGSWGAQFLAALTLRLNGKPVSRDIMSGLFGGKTAVYSKVVEEHGHAFERKGFKILFDLMKHGPADAKVSESVFEFGERAGGESKISGRVVLSILNQCDGWGRFVAKLAKPFLKA